MKMRTQPLRIGQGFLTWLSVSGRLCIRIGGLGDVSFPINGGKECWLNWLEGSLLGKDFCLQEAILYGYFVRHKSN